MAIPPDFTTGAVLTAAQMNAVGLWRITTCTVTSVGGTSATATDGVVTLGAGNTSVAIANAFSADYNSYKIVVNNGTSSGVTFLTLSLTGSTTGYYASLVYGPYAGGAAATVGTNNGAAWQYAGGVIASSLFMGFELDSPFLAKPTMLRGSYADGTNTGSITGYHSVATSYTGFTFAPNAGNISAAEIRVYGYNT
jgi:hypothetical protein